MWAGGRVNRDAARRYWTILHIDDQRRYDPRTGSSLMLEHGCKNHVINNLQLVDELIGVERFRAA